MAISENLKELIWKHRVTAAQISRATSIPQPTIHHILSGKTKNPRRNILEKLSLYFGITIDQLMGKDIPRDTNIQESLSPKEALTTLALKPWGKEKQEATVSVEANLNYHLGILLDTDEFEPVFPINSTIFLSKDLTFKDKGYCLIIKDQNKFIARTFVDEEEVYMKLIGKGQAKQIMHIDELQYDFIYSIKEMRSPL